MRIIVAFAAIGGLLVGLGFSAPQVVQAQLQEGAERFQQLREQVQQQFEGFSSQSQIQERIQEQTEQLRRQREELRTRAGEQQIRRQFSEEEMLQRRGEYRERFESQRRQAQEEFESRRAEFEMRAQELRQQRQEEVEQRRQEFRERVAQIQDEQRRLLAERLSEHINTVNQRFSDAALRYLDALELVLGKIEVRTDYVEDATGIDMTPVRDEIASARTSIEEARTAVLAQKSKEYVVALESQQTIGRDIRATMQELRNDHQALRENVLRPLRLLVRDVAEVMKAAVEQGGQEAAEALEQELETGENIQEQ